MEGGEQEKKEIIQSEQIEEEKDSENTEVVITQQIQELKEES